MLSLGNPKHTLQRIHSLIGGLCDQLNVLCQQEEEEEAATQTASLMLSDGSISDCSVRMEPSTPSFDDVSVFDHLPDPSIEGSQSNGSDSAATASPTVSTVDANMSKLHAPVSSSSTTTPGIAFVDHRGCASQLGHEPDVHVRDPMPLTGLACSASTDSVDGAPISDGTTLSASPFHTGPTTPVRATDALVSNAGDAAEINAKDGALSVPFTRPTAFSVSNAGNECILASPEEIDNNLLADINKLSKNKLMKSKSSSSASLSSLGPTPVPFPSTPNKPDNSFLTGVAKSNSKSLYLGETIHLMADRWEKLYKDFYSAKLGMYDLSKVPDVYDSIRYEVLHNSHLPLTGMSELFDLATKFENTVVPQEYGTVADDKRRIGSMMCNSLLDKIKHDLLVSKSNTSGDIRYMLDSSHAPHLEINSIDRAVRSRLYFTSESHLYTLLNVLRYSAEGQPKAFCPGGLEKLDSVSELSYLTQVAFRLFQDKSDVNNFRVEISFSAGAIYDPSNPDSCDISPYILLNKSIPCDELLQCLEDAISACDTRSEAPTPVEGMLGGANLSPPVSGRLSDKTKMAGDEAEASFNLDDNSESRVNSGDKPAGTPSSSKSQAGSPFSSQALARAHSHRKIVPSGITVVSDDKKW
jgi:hypothetical protein